MDIRGSFNITSAHHHNPFTPKARHAQAALRLETGTRVLDLGSGSGEVLCTWARDHGVVGTGIDLSRLFTEQANLRARELGVADRVEFIHGDAAGFVSPAEGRCGRLSGCHVDRRKSSAPSSFWRRACGPEGSSSSASPTGGSCRRRKRLPRVSCRLDLRLSCFGTSRVFRPAQARRRGDGPGRPGQLGPVRGGQVAHDAPMARSQSRDEFAKRFRAQLTSEPVRYATYTRIPGMGRVRADGAVTDCRAHVTAQKRNAHECRRLVPSRLR